MRKEAFSTSTNNRNSYIRTLTINSRDPLVFLSVYIKLAKECLHIADSIMPRMMVNLLNHILDPKTKQNVCKFYSDSILQ